MTPTDEKFAQLDRIEQECFHGSWTSETLLSEINSPLNVLCTEESGGITAGFALGRVVADEAELFQIAVLPEFRRQGIAQRLLERLHGEMKSRGAVCCFLEVRSRNSAAIALYEKARYEYISTRRNYYPDDDAAIYRIAL
jgi:ribosomal-protein-alanine N-acetyltransferase